jgi:hypothetical protein
MSTRSLKDNSLRAQDWKGVEFTSWASFAL